ncbi:MAG: hypothetical protein ACRDHW_17155, partial [Ktedonobacteraceae bacterium]
MVFAAQLRSASQKALGARLNTHPLTYHLSSHSPGLYMIQRRQQSECALILFTQQERPLKHWAIQALQKCKDVLRAPRALQEQQLQFEPLVIKVLRDYHDMRYNLDTLEKRQRCQIEALRLNRAFTPEVYLGLARINRDVYDWSKKSLQLGEILPSPSSAMLDPNAEYALVMRRLPDQRRLDLLLQAKNEATLQLYMHMLAKHVADMHEPLPPISRKAIWGSYEQLQGKLLHNFALLDLVLTKDPAYASLKDRLTILKETLKQIFMQSSYRDYFQQRVNRQSIKHCHGDLKAPHIWIVSEEERRQEKKPG